MGPFVHFAKLSYQSAPLFLQALWLTLIITFCAVIFSLPIGLLFALFQQGKNRFLISLARLYINIVRGTPLIVQIFILYFGLTNIVQLGPLTAASLALAFHNGAYISEIFRGGLQSIGKGQFEAAQALGIGPYIMYRKIIFPQVLKRSLPGLGNQFIITLKDSSLAAFISINELFNTATTLGANNFDQMTYLIMASMYYLFLVTLFSSLIKVVEKKYAYIEQ